MPSHSNAFFVLTGGPGSGKTSLIEALRARGFATAPEAGRGIIRDQMEIGGGALPWQDPALFAELMLAWELRSWREADAAAGPVFFDRGVPDTLGYLRLTGLPAPAHMQEAAKRFRYHRRVFIAPPWPEIFTQDSERRQSLEEARRTHDAVAAAYRDYDYELVPLPLASVADRADFVTDQIKLG